MFIATNTALIKMSCRRGRCPGSEIKGSGYTKPANTELARESASAMEALLAARAAQDAKWEAAWTAAAQRPVDPKALTNVRADGSPTG
jgi:hypothetical protein